MGFVVEGAPARRMSPSLSMISGGRLSFLSSSENAKVLAEGGTHIGKPFFSFTRSIPNITCIFLGNVTSGIPSPTLSQNIAMGYVRSGYHKKGTTVKVEVRNKLRDAKVVGLPFVKTKYFRG